VIRTERLLMRHWRSNDRAPFAQLNADPRVMAHFPAPLDHSASDAMADKIEARLVTNGWGFWAVELQTSGEFIGFVGLNPGLAELPFAPCVEIGWRIAFAQWGRGYAQECAHAALAFGFETLDLSEIVAFTALSNRRSQALMQRIGMQEDAASRFDHPSLPSDSALRAHCLYRQSRLAWLAR
jgi:RimJ/RimL family protein N-acetyltransferase